MITLLDIFPILANEFPALRADPKLIDDIKSPYKNFRWFVDHTLKALKNDDKRSARSCAKLAERILGEGDRQVRSAFEFVFISSLEASGASARPEFESFSFAPVSLRD